MTNSEKRTSLARFVNREITAAELADLHPDCECENAESPPGGYGSVGDDERLRYFLTSPSNREIEKPADMKKNLFRRKDLNRAFGRGLSVCRLKYAGNELIETANNLYEIQRERLKEQGRNEKIGGIIGFVDFDAGLIRQATKPFCVYETPLEDIGGNRYRFHSHADVTCSVGSTCRDEIRDNCRNVFSHLMESNSTKITDGSSPNFKEFLEFLPETAR